MSLALVVSLDIPQVTRVSILAVWQAMLVAFRVKVASPALMPSGAKQSPY